MSNPTFVRPGPTGFDLDIPIDCRPQVAADQGGSAQETPWPRPAVRSRRASRYRLAGAELRDDLPERVEGPLGPTSGSPGRVCWKIAEGTLTGPRLRARLAMPGTDWIRVDRDGIRRQDQRAQFRTEGGALILMRYDTGIIQADQTYLAAISSGHPTNFGDQYMYMVPQFEVAGDEHGWLTRHLFIGRGRLAGANQIEYELYRLD